MSARAAAPWATLRNVKRLPLPWLLAAAFLLSPARVLAQEGPPPEEDPDEEAVEEEPSEDLPTTEEPTDEEPTDVEPTEVVPIEDEAVIVTTSQPSAMDLPLDDSGTIPQGEFRQFKWMALPTAGYDADDGVGLGVLAELWWLMKGYEPYRADIRFLGFLTDRGHHNHRLIIDLPDMGQFHGLRFTAYVAYRQWLNDGYWGIGNGVNRERAFVGNFDIDDPRRKRYKYQLVQPFAHLMLRYDLGPVLGAFVATTIQWTRVRTYSGSLLEEHAPTGLDGGWSVQASLGFMWDTREPEVVPDRGVFAEVSGRVVPSISEPTEVFGGPFGSIRVFLPVKPGRAVLAWRVMGEWLFGDIPFYEMVRWGGSEPIMGFGGGHTIRGAKFGRWRGPAKAVANLELRVELGRHPALKSELRWQLVAFGDIGGVWGAGDDATAEAPEFPLHAGTGLGVRAILADTFVARLDLGLSPDPIEEEDGTIVRPPSFGLYITVDSMF